MAEISADEFESHLENLSKHAIRQKAADKANRERVTKPKPLPKLPSWVTQRMSFDAKTASKALRVLQPDFRYLLLPGHQSPISKLINKSKMTSEIERRESETLRDSGGVGGNILEDLWVVRAGSPNTTVIKAARPEKEESDRRVTTTHLYAINQDGAVRSVPVLGFFDMSLTNQYGDVIQAPDHEKIHDIEPAMSDEEYARLGAVGLDGSGLSIQWRQDIAAIYNRTSLGLVSTVWVNV